MRSVVILSGGLDSCVALGMEMARERDGAALALTFDYGQRAAAREVAAARAMAARYGIEHRVLPLPSLREVTRTALVDRGAAVPRPTDADLDSAAARETARAVWVPNRNGVFIAIAAAFAEARGLDRLLVGFNREEGVTFPDNTPEFVARTNAALEYSTLAKVRVESPVGGLDKVEIVRAGREVGAPIPLVWSCYLGGEEHCGSCESCKRLHRALAGAGALDWFLTERKAALAGAGR